MRMGNIILFSSILGIILFVFIFAVSAYMISIARDLMFLTSGQSMESVELRFGQPREVYTKGDVVQGYGWPAPSRKIDYEMRTYTRINGMKYFVYYDDQGNVTYVYSSRS